MKINKDYIAIAMIAVIFILYLNVTLSSSIVFGDEGYYGYQAKYIADEKIMPKYEVFKETDVYHPVLTKTPLFMISESFGFLFGESVVKFMIPLFAALAAFMLYIFLKKTVSEKAGLTATLLYLATPSLITYGVLGYVDVMLSLFMICSLYFGYRAFEDGNRRDTLLAGIFSGLAVLTKITAPILLVIFFLYMIATKKYDKWKVLLIIILITGALLAPWIARNLMLFGGTCYGPADCPAVTDVTIQKTAGLDFAGRTSGGGTEASLMSIGFINYSNFAFGMIIIFLGLFGIVSAIRGKSKMQILMLAMLICMIPIFVFYSGRAEDAARYTLPVVIPIAILGGMFLSDSYDWMRKKSFMVAIIVIMLIIAGTWYIAQEKLNTMVSVKTFPAGFYDACNWVKVSTPSDSLLLSIYSQQTAYTCDRRTSTAVPDMPDIMLSNSDTSYQHLKLHGYDYVFVMVNLLSQTAYSESVPVGFFNYMDSSDKFERVFDNTQTYGSGGVVIFKVN